MIPYCFHMVFLLFVKFINKSKKILLLSISPYFCVHNAKKN